MYIEDGLRKSKIDSKTMRRKTAKLSKSNTLETDINSSIKTVTSPAEQDQFMYQTDLGSHGSIPASPSIDSKQDPMMSYAMAQRQLLKGFGDQAGLNKSVIKGKTLKAGEITEPATQTCCFWARNDNVKKQKLSKSLQKKLNNVWHTRTQSKIEQIFRADNQSQVPEWLDGFQKQLRKRTEEIKENGVEYQTQFYTQIKKYKGVAGKQQPSYKIFQGIPSLNETPQNSGTIKRVLTDLQRTILV